MQHPGHARERTLVCWIRRRRKRTSEVVSQARLQSKDMLAVGLAQRSLRSKLHQDCAEPLVYPCGTSVSDGALSESAPQGVCERCGGAEAGASPSSEVPPGWLTRHAARQIPMISPAAGRSPG